MKRSASVLFIYALITFSIQSQVLLTLSDAFDLASAHSPDLKQSALSLVRSQENLKAQRAALKSSFSLGLDPYSFSNELKYDDTPDGDGWYNVQQTRSGGMFSISQPVLLTDATIALSNTFRWQDYNGNQSYYNNLNLRIDQPLFSHNQQKIALQEVELEVESAELSYALQTLSMERSVTSQFFGVYQKQMQVLIQKEEYANQQLNHNIVTQKVEAGLQQLEELYQSEVNLITSENEWVTAQVKLQDAMDDFRVLLGVGFDYDFVTVLNVQVDSVPIDWQQATERALEVTQELRQREIDIDMAQFSLLQTIDNNSFSGKVSLQMGLSGQDPDVFNIYDKAINNTGISLSFEVPIWDWGKRKAKIRSAELNVERLELLESNERTDIELTLRKLHRSVESLYGQIEKANINVRNAQLTYDTNLERFKRGQLSGMDLQLFQNQLSQKKMAQTNALINYKLELLNLKIQTLYDWERMEEFFGVISFK